MIEFYDALWSLKNKKANDDQYKVIQEPTNEEEYNLYVKFVSGTDSTGQVLFHDTPLYTWQEVQDEKLILETEFTATQYQRSRAEVYPSIGDQLDMMYWDKINSTTKWQEAIAKVKDVYKKPTE